MPAATNAPWACMQKRLIPNANYKELKLIAQPSGRLQTTMPHKSPVWAQTATKRTFLHKRDLQFFPS